MDTNLTDVLDELRGELDRAHQQPAGWSGPITAAYILGFGDDYDSRQKREARAYVEGHTEHGWYT